MIGNAVRELLMQNEENFIISDEKVAYVLDTHPVTHAFLLLAKVGFSKIPVLNKDGGFEGFISLGAVNNAMFDVNGIIPEKIDDLLVKDIMETDVQVLYLPYDIEDVLHLLVDHPFLPVVDQERQFKGIVTRKEILKAVNHLAHELDNQYVLTKKEKQTETASEPLEPSEQYIL